MDRVWRKERYWKERERGLLRLVDLVVVASELRDTAQAAGLASSPLQLVVALLTRKTSHMALAQKGEKT